MDGDFQNSGGTPLCPVKRSVFSTVQGGSGRFPPANGPIASVFRPFSDRSPAPRFSVRAFSVAIQPSGRTLRALHRTPPMSGGRQRIGTAASLRFRPDFDPARKVRTVRFTKSRLPITPPLVK